MVITAIIEMMPALTETTGRTHKIKMTDASHAVTTTAIATFNKNRLNIMLSLFFICCRIFFHILFLCDIITDFYRSKLYN